MQCGDMCDFFGRAGSAKEPSGPGPVQPSEVLVAQQQANSNTNTQRQTCSDPISKNSALDDSTRSLLQDPIGSALRSAFRTHRKESVRYTDISRFNV